MGANSHCHRLTWPIDNRPLPTNIYGYRHADGAIDKTGLDKKSRGPMGEPYPEFGEAEVSMSAIVAIPARLKSTRFPQKVLAKMVSPS